MKFKNAQNAFERLYNKINVHGVIQKQTKTLFNEGFYLENPLDNHIATKFRKWNPTYAEREWAWYESKDPDATEISKYAPIWKNHMDENGCVQSNYGWQLDRNDQLNKVIARLQKDNDSRHGVVSIYDGKEINKYNHDTPCTMGLHFQILDNKLNMSVVMRSNDLWFGFCNDQYCFSLIQKKVAEALQLDLGWYYHFSTNLHLYNNYLNKNL